MVKHTQTIRRVKAMYLCIFIFKLGRALTYLIGKLLTNNHSKEQI